MKTEKASLILNDHFNCFNMYSGGNLRNQKIVMGLDSIPNQRLIHFGPIWIILLSVYHLSETAFFKISLFLKCKKNMTMSSFCNAIVIKSAAKISKIGSLIKNYAQNLF